MAGSGGGGGNGNGSGGGGGSGGGDMGSTTSGGDMAGAPTGTKQFGELCTLATECQSGICGQFVMGTVHRCSKSCTVATQATDCPAPPSDGTCNNNGYCKFSQ
jgi:hypothetical protein